MTGWREASFLPPCPDIPTFPSMFVDASTSGCRAPIIAVPEPRGCERFCGTACEPISFDLLSTYGDVVDHYLAVYGPRVEADRRFFGNRGLTDEAAVELAFLSCRRDGRLHEHQHRVGYRRMAAAAAAMKPHASAIVAAVNFAELHHRVAAIRREVQGIGDLTIYDVAQRIGWFRRLEPAEIYLHRGTRQGAAALVTHLRGPTLAVDRLPLELRVLTAAQLEDVLCIYKAELHRIASRG